MMRRVPSFLSRSGFALFPIIIAACGVVGPLQEKTVVLTVDHLPDKALAVTASNGKVEARRELLAAVEVTAEVRALTEERLAQVEVRVERNADGALVVRALWPDNKLKSREGCDFRIATPGAHGVELRSSNGSLKAIGLSGVARLDTSNGSVTVEEHAGSLEADTSNGSIKVRELAGDLRAQTSNGRIEASGVAGAIWAKASNGSVDIALASSSAGPVDAESSNGSITLALSEGFAGTLDLITSNGSVKIDNGLESRVVSRQAEKARLQFDHTGPASRASTSNGSIHVRPGR